MDLGVLPDIMAGNIIGVIAQRLVRKLCTACRRQDADGRWQAVGCPRCGESGYHGRTGIYELLLMTPRLAATIHGGGAEADLRRIAVEEGMLTMAADAERWIAAGVTTREEVARATRD
jgi:general secretion pathway protein E